MDVPTLLIFVFVFGYAAIVFERQIGINKSASALVTSVFCWVLISYQHFPQTDLATDHLNVHLSNISQILFFLMGAMTIVELINTYQGFGIITKVIVTRNSRSLLWLISLTTFFASAVLDNMTTAIIMVTLLRGMIHDKKDRIIFASMVIVAANAGGAWSPIGDVTTTMLWISQRISSGKLISLLFLPSLMSVIVPLIYCSCLVQNQQMASSFLESQEKPSWGTKRVFILGISALILVPILRAMTGLPPYMGIILGVGMMWGLTDLMHQEQYHLRVPHVLTRIDISSILFFLGILLVVSALETAGLLNRLAAWMDMNLGSKDVIVTILGLVSSIIDNVPLTAAAMGMYRLEAFPIDSKIWEMIAFCVGTGGSILIIGSAAGVVVMGMEKISFFWYLRKMSLPIFLGYIVGIGVFLIQTHVF